MSDAFAGATGQQFVAHYQSLRGVVRTQIVHRQLVEHLPPPPAPVVDVGGGAGTQAIPLARAGYDVTIVDPSPAMLEHAAEALLGEDPDVAARVTLVEAPGEVAHEVLGAGQAAGVLCHGVLPYLDDPARVLGALVTLAAPGGVISIVTKSAASLAMRPAMRRQWGAALDAFDARREVNGLGLETRVDHVDALADEMRRREVEVLGWYGVRLFSDLLPEDEEAPDQPDLAAILAVEWEASRRDPYRQVSRLFHLIGMRRSRPDRG